jgi:hypothetical protein
VNLDSRKNACTIKFKEIVSAEKAAEYAANNLIWNDMNVKVIYNTQAPPKLSMGMPLLSSSLLDLKKV